MRSTDGWQVVSIKGGDQAGGVTSHRGVLHPDEYVDWNRVVFEAENRLGYTLADLWDAYCQGPKSAAQREHRAGIDAALLAISEAGGNLTALAHVMDMRPETFARAVARARQIRKEEA
jgi:hypothetical protein